MLQKTTALAYLLTALGLGGIIVSLVMEQSDYDPVAFGIATVSILVAIIGLSLAFKMSSEDGQAERAPSKPFP